MTPLSGTRVLHHLRRLLGGPAPSPAGDAELLRRFVAARDGDAFAALVRRHGPVVFSVCRSVLRHQQDAEDAFQATFLVLARRATAVRKPASLGSWLHGVAYRLALKARARSADRQRRTQQLPVPAEATSMDDLTWRELREVLHEELARLPESFRVPVLLCYFEGRTQDEAARQLGCAKATVKDRLARARDLLRCRLTRRGLALSVPLFAAWLAGGTEAAPAALAEATADAALGFVAGDHSTRAALLADGVVRALSLTRLKLTLAAATLALGLVLAGVALAAGLGGTGRAPEPRHHADPPRPPEDARPQARIDALGDPLPDEAVARLGTTRFRQGTRVIALSFSPDGKKLATASQDCVANLWDATTGLELFRFGRPDQYLLVYNVAISPDGKTLASAHGDGILSLWDGATGKELRQLKGCTSDLRGLAFSPDGSLLYASESAPGPVRCWETATGKEVRQFPGREQGSGWIALSPDGKVLAAEGLDHALVLWDTATGKELRRWKASNGYSPAIAFAPDGKTLATANATTVTLWDAETGKRLHDLRGHDDVVHALAFAPDGKTIATGGRDRSVRVWDAATGKELVQVRDTRNSVLALAYTPDGKAIATGGGAAVLFWDAATGKQVNAAEGHLGELFAVARSPDGKLVASAGRDRTVITWDAATGKVVRRLNGHTSEVYALAFSPDGKLLASAGADKTVRLWEVGGLPVEVARWEAHKGGVGFLGFGADGKTLASGEWNPGIVRVWELYGEDGKVRAEAKMRREFKVHDNRASCMAFSPDGKVVATADEQEQRFSGIDVSPHPVRLWDVTTGKQLFKLDGHHGGQMRGMAFSPDGKVLATGGNGFGDQIVRLWDVATGKELKQLKTEAERVCFSPDGRTLATVAYADPTIRLWELATGQERLALKGHHDGVTDLEFTPDGKRLLSASRDTTVLVWDVTGLAGAAVRKTPPTAKELDGLWQDLLGGDTAKSYRAGWAMASAPEQAVPLLKDRLLRADAKRVERLLADLDSDRFEVREEAAAELDRIAERAEPALRKAKEEGSPEVKRRAEKLLEALPVRAARLVEVLENAGTPEAREVIEELGKGPAEAKVTAEAKAARDRLASRGAR
jgi:RNA polymerase sigma factor (sigma-70 family)